MSSGSAPLEDGAAGCINLSDVELFGIHFKVVLRICAGALEKLYHIFAAGLGSMLHKCHCDVGILASDHIADDLNLAGRYTSVLDFRSCHFLFVHVLSPPYLPVLLPA